MKTFEEIYKDSEKTLYDNVVSELENSLELFKIKKHKFTYKVAFRALLSLLPSGYSIEIEDSLDFEPELGLSLIKNKIVVFTSTPIDYHLDEEDEFDIDKGIEKLYEIFYFIKQNEYIDFVKNVKIN